LESFDQGGIKPHEKTFAGPKQDRYQLMQATEAQLSPIFALYSDPKKLTGPQLEKWSQGEPLIHIRQENGEEHRLWKVGDAATVNVFLASVQDYPLLIADGHHRYETALNFCLDRKAALGNAYTGAENFNYVLMYLCSLEDPGLVILPTHRVLKERPEGDLSLFNRLIDEVGTRKSFPLDRLKEAVEWMQQEAEQGHRIAWLHDGVAEVIELDAEKVLNSQGLNH
jgi:uncharacterized protein (DUF1015 family)